MSTHAARSKLPCKEAGFKMLWSSHGLLHSFPSIYNRYYGLALKVEMACPSVYWWTCYYCCTIVILPKPIQLFPFLCTFTALVYRMLFLIVTGQTEISIFPGLHSPLCSCLSSHSLPKVVKRRVNALKNLQVKCAHIEAKFYEEVHELERKYAALYQPLFDKVCHLHIFFIVIV